MLVVQYAAVIDDQIAAGNRVAFSAQLTDSLTGYHIDKFHGIGMTVQGARNCTEVMLPLSGIEQTGLPQILRSRNRQIVLHTITHISFEMLLLYGTDDVKSTMGKENRKIFCSEK